MLNRWYPLCIYAPLYLRFTQFISLFLPQKICNISWAKESILFCIADENETKYSPKRRPKPTHCKSTKIKQPVKKSTKRDITGCPNFGNLVRYLTWLDQFTVLLCNTLFIKFIDRQGLSKREERERTPIGFRALNGKCAVFQLFPPFIPSIWRLLFTTYYDGLKNKRRAL